jgi:biopolymer transport protein ExbD
MAMRESITEQLDEEGEAEINLTPMLDVVFIMLIFFIVTAVFVKDPGVEVTRPEAETAFSPGAGSIFVAITATDQIWIDGNQVQRPDVRAAISDLRAEAPESGVIIQSDSAAHNETLIAVMDAARAAGIQDIAVAAGPRQ